jgi:hypothetical protein
MGQTACAQAHWRDKTRRMAVPMPPIDAARGADAALAGAAAMARRLAGLLSAV